MVHRTTLSVSQLVLVDQDLFFWVVVLHARFRRNVVPSKRRETSKHWKMKASHSFETSGTDYFVTQRHTPEERNTKPHSCEHLKTHNDRWRNIERNPSWRNLRHWLDVFWKKLRKVAKHPNQDGRLSDRDLNTGLSIRRRPDSHSTVKFGRKMYKENL